MDPQQRLMLETTWHALEDANIAPKKLARSQTGVFIGVMNHEWEKITFSDPKQIEVYNGTGNGHAMIANRISYVYNLKGPSLAVDTACSSSLVAVELACQYLGTSDLEIAIVGSVNLILTPSLNMFYQKAGLASKVGRCQAFGHFADGIVRGEGAGVVVLKRAADAIAAGDRIYAIIKGSAVNQDGLSNGITAPNRFAQMDVISRALKKASKTATELQFVEAHGTGTLMGDPIEASALTEAISQFKKTPLYIGSVKSHIGHLEGTAGMAGLIKTALSIHHQTLPPHLHVGRGNAHINFEKANLHIPTQLQPWPDEVRLAGVSAFGLGGTNAHLILESVPSSYKTSLDKVIPYAFQRKIHTYHEMAHKPSQESTSNQSIDSTTMEDLSSQELYTRVLAIAAKISGINLSNVDTKDITINDIGFDSMMIIDFKNEIEKILGIEGKLELKNMLALKTVSDLINHLHQLMTPKE